MKTLGICIPTYRRPALLERCVRSAIASANGRPLRIFIADDAVSDANVETMTRLQEAHDFIVWHRNPTNLGIDRNIQRALALNDCDRGWLIGEDDLFLPGAVERMHAFVQTCDAPFVFANYVFATEDHRRILGPALPVDGPASPSTDAFVEHSLWATGFIGCCVVDREAWARIDGTPFDGTYFTHVGRILGLLAAGAAPQVLRAPSIANRSQGEDTFTWKRDAFGVFLGFERMCAIASARWPVLAGPLDRAVVHYRAKFTYFSIKSTLRLRAYGAFDLRQFRAYVRPTRLAPWRKAWMFGLALVPQALLRPLARAYVRRQQRRLDAGDVQA